MKKRVILSLCAILLCATTIKAQSNPPLLATGNTNKISGPIPARGLSGAEIEGIINEINPYTLYRKGSTVEYCFEKDGKQKRITNTGGPSYVQLSVVEETIEDGLLVAYIKRDWLNKKHKPSKGLPKGFKEQLLRVEIDTTGTCFQIYDIPRDIYYVTEKKGYTMAITKDLKKGNNVICGTLTNICKIPLFGKYFHHTIVYSNFKVVEEEEVTTPAGTFNCLKLSGIINEYAEEYGARFYHNECNIWICKGVGIVRYEILEDSSPWVMYLNKADIK